MENTVYVPEKLTGSKGSQRGQIVQSLLDASVGGDEHYDHEIDEEIVYLGSLFNHFGHFLMQSLARTWFLTDVNPSVRVLFDPPSKASGQLPDWMPQILEAFGVPPERILVLDAPTRLRRLIIPEPLFAPRGMCARPHRAGPRGDGTTVSGGREAPRRQHDPLGATRLPQSPAPPGVPTHDRW